MAKRDLRTGELLTTNYSWTKPTVGSSVDAWGGFVNADLDAIDSVVHGIDARTASAPYVPQAGYVPAINPSRIINGDMLRDQRNNGASGTAIGYTCDRWQFSSTLATKGTWQRNGGATDGVLAATGFAHYLDFTSNSAYTPAASDYFRLLQVVEADMITDFAWGTANAQPVTLSFWAASSLAGAFSGSISTFPAATRAYPFTYTIPSAGTWTKIVVTIPGDNLVSSTNWVLAGNGAALGVQFDLGSGATFRGPANAWASANYVGVTGAVSTVSTNGAYFLLTGVKLEIGSVATPFNRQSLAKSMADCQRYYSVGPPLRLAGYGLAGQGAGQAIAFPVAMRAAPMIVVNSSPTYTNCSGLAASGTIDVGGTSMQVIVTAAGGFVVSCNPVWTADAEL